MLQNDLKKWIETEAKAIASIPVNGGLSDTIHMIHQQVHEQGGKVVISGVGKAGQTGMMLATTLCSTGIPASFLHPTEAQHGDLGILQKEDVLFLISNSGRTREVVELCSLAKNLIPAIHIVVLTSNPESPLAREGDTIINIGKTEEICPLGLTPTTSTTVMSVIGDLIVVGLMKKTGFTKEEYGKRHHSGYLGEKARKP